MKATLHALVLTICFIIILIFGYAWSILNVGEFILLGSFGLIFGILALVELFREEH